MTIHREPLAPRAALPSAAQPYRTIGPFDASSLPEGLRTIHRLKPGVWGLLELSQGSVGFCWDDERGGRQDLTAPAVLVVPPEVPHHLEPDGEFQLSVTFLR